MKRDIGIKESGEGITNVMEEEEEEMSPVCHKVQLNNTGTPINHNPVYYTW